MSVGESYFVKFEFVESIFPASFSSQGVLNKDPTLWLDRASPPPLVEFVLPWPENEFGKVIIGQIQSPQRKS